MTRDGVPRVVVNLELTKLPFQIMRIPEWHVVEEFSTHRTNHTTKHDELLLEQEILRDHHSHATGARQLRDHDSEVEQGSQRRPDAASRATLPSLGISARIVNVETDRFGEPQAWLVLE